MKICHVVLAYIWQFLTIHKEMLVLFALALIVTMHDKLPAPFSKVEWMEWSYEWLHNALVTFVSLRTTDKSKLEVSKTTDPAGNVTELKSVATEIKDPKDQKV